jgi:tRNA pseudouridine55 synthase
VLDKPSGITSRALVDRVARLLPRTKVGHAGTLDPLASGVLVVCVGAATRLVELLHQLPKSYRTVVRLGARSDTLDADGRIYEEPHPEVPALLNVERSLERFRGEVVQVPPAYSALRIKGQRAYDLARAGKPVEPAPRVVRIERITLLRYAWPHVELEVDCGSGTFIRSIARDLGEAFGCGGLVESLIRTKVGSFALDQVVDLAELSAETLVEYLRPTLAAVPDLPRVVLDDRQLESVAHGRRIALAELAGSVACAGRVALVDQAGRLVALGDPEPQTGWLQPRKVLI